MRSNKKSLKIKTGEHHALPPRKEQKLQKLHTVIKQQDEALINLRTEIQMMQVAPLYRMISMIRKLPFTPVLNRLLRYTIRPMYRWLYDQFLKIKLFPYQRWIISHEIFGDKNIGNMADEELLLSVIFDGHHASLHEIIDVFRCLKKQPFQNWEMCVVISKEMQGNIRKYVGNDNRFKSVFSPAASIREAISVSTGEYLVFLPEHTVLSRNALRIIASEVKRYPNTGMFYTDEDVMGICGIRSNPNFKPGLSPDYLRSCNYIKDKIIVKRACGEALGWLRRDFGSAALYDLIFRLTEKYQCTHIPKVLFHEHRNHHKVKPADATHTARNEQQVIADHLRRIRRTGAVNVSEMDDVFQIKYSIKTSQKVSIIILNKDNAALLKTCVVSIFKMTTYKNYEVIIVENNSILPDTFAVYDELRSRYRVKIIAEPKGAVFNYAAFNNHAVHKAVGDIILFLNNDMEVLTGDWLERMVEHLQFKENGIVGATLLYKNNTIQHAGVLIGIQGTAAHEHRHFPADSPGYFGRLKSIHNVSAVTGACLMMRRNVFDEVGGFDERFPVALNDVDLCLKVREKGYLIITTPYARLLHFESITRGYDQTDEQVRRKMMEIVLLGNKWESVFRAGDPYYNINLTARYEDFSVREK
ncbi:MAG: glycosyltransferase family 2 protein [Spirochaetes bacterium]|nr:glycosyltransferase family 2 protein [Spirochaetota bacterium]